MSIPETDAATVLSSLTNPRGGIPDESMENKKAADKTAVVERQLRPRVRAISEKRQRQLALDLDRRGYPLKKKVKRTTTRNSSPSLRRSERKRKAPWNLGFYVANSGNNRKVNKRKENWSQVLRTRAEIPVKRLLLRETRRSTHAREEVENEDDTVLVSEFPTLGSPRRKGLRTRLIKAKKREESSDEEVSESESDGEKPTTSNKEGRESGQASRRHDVSAEEEWSDKRGMEEEEGDEDEVEEGMEDVVGATENTAVAGADIDKEKVDGGGFEQGRIEDEQEEDGEEEEDDEDMEGEREGGKGEERRYALRSRTLLKRFSPRPVRPQVPAGRRPHPQHQPGVKRGRGEGRYLPGGRKRHHIVSDGSDEDSILLDEAHAVDAQWVPPPGVEFLGPSGWFGEIPGHSMFRGKEGLNVAGKLGSAGKLGGADVQPVQVDQSVTFSDVGGLSKHINSLKEMVFFPLLYPQFFAQYSLRPPRGVLLCGPPGTGKTLVARALASAASSAGGRHVSFFMRKGADVLSKWVGESERQLRLLFEEARRCQPSIIFFDEIDGLAPVRSSRQEQIHNSIVSTLLALMDGLDSRGQVVVVGATNRVDAIDPALRRPGRFDREFHFPLPDVDARRAILGIHTRKWQKPPTATFLDDLARATAGYCGADIGALCAEAAIRAFRATYPQVYESEDQLEIDVEAVTVEEKHFWAAMADVKPASHRSAVVHARPLLQTVEPLLKSTLDRALKKLEEVFPAMLGKEEEEEEEEEEEITVFGAVSTFPFLPRPRLLLCGKPGFGQDHVGPAILHCLERFPVHSLGLPSLLSDPSAKTPEEALVRVFGEAMKNAPAILFLPHLELWWETAHDALRATLLMLAMDVAPTLPLLILGSADVSVDEIEAEAKLMFGHNIFVLEPPARQDRESFFRPVVQAASSPPKLVKKTPKQMQKWPELPKVRQVTSEPTEAELKKRAEEDEHAMRRLRMCLRDVCNRLLHEKRFSIFHFPVDEEEDPEFSNVVTKAMDVSTLLHKVDTKMYQTKDSFLRDVELILQNAQVYYGDDYNGPRIVSKAFALRDAVHGMLSHMDPVLVKACEEIAARGGPYRLPMSESNEKEADAMYATPSPCVHGLAVVNQERLPAVTTRASARLRGVQPLVDMSKSPNDILRQKRQTSEANSVDGLDSVTNGSSPVRENDVEIANGNYPFDCVSEDQNTAHVSYFQKNEEATGGSNGGNKSQGLEEVNADNLDDRNILKENNEDGIKRIYGQVTEGKHTNLLDIRTVMGVKESEILKNGNNEDEMKRILAQSTEDEVDIQTSVEMESEVLEKACASEARIHKGDAAETNEDGTCTNESVESKERGELFLHNIVHATGDCTVSELENLIASFRQVLHQHRKCRDRLVVFDELHKVFDAQANL